jgi:predicted DNA-binding transcriptional regulator YafY
MKHVISDYIRQAEILAYALNGEKYSKSDLSEKYNVGEITINRDLKALRDHGIGIFSKNGKIEIIDRPPKEALISTAADYLPLTLNSDVFVKQVKAFSKYADYYPKLILLAKAVKESLIVNIKYKRFKDDALNDYIIAPVRLYIDGYNWIFNGIKKGEDETKSFYLSRMQEVKLTDMAPKKLPLSSINKKQYEIKLRFVPSVRDQLLDKVWFEDFKMEEDEEGRIVLTVKAPLTRRLAAWCITWEDCIEILSPVELKEFIRGMIDCYLKHNHI